MCLNLLFIYLCFLVSSIWDHTYHIWQVAACIRAVGLVSSSKLPRLDTHGHCQLSDLWYDQLMFYFSCLLLHGTLKVMPHESHDPTLSAVWQTVSVVILSADNGSTQHIVQTITGWLSAGKITTNIVGQHSQVGCMAQLLTCIPAPCLLSSFVSDSVW